MRPRKPVLLVTTRGELRFMLRSSSVHVELYTAESREELKAHLGRYVLLAVIDGRDMQQKGVEMFVAKVREGFPGVKILLIRKHGDVWMHGADVALAPGWDMAIGLLETIRSLTAVKRGPRKVGRPAVSEAAEATA